MNCEKSMNRKLYTNTENYTRKNSRIDIIPYLKKCTTHNICLINNKKLEFLANCAKTLCTIVI